MRMMTKWCVALAVLALAACSEKEINRRAAYAEKVARHPMSKLLEAQRGQKPPKGPQADRPDLAFAHNFLMTMDPALGRPAPERLEQAYVQMQALQSKRRDSIPPLQWTERGPSQVGGRTRALMWDPNDSSHTKVWAGGVSGGLWYNEDITLFSKKWQPVNDFWRTLSVTALAYDPTQTQTFYAGTGEGQARASQGEGIWKSTDGGSSWQQLPASKDFTHINDLVVRQENGQGVLYVAVKNDDYEGFTPPPGVEGLYRSTDGGSTFQQVLPTVSGQNYPYAPMDLEIGPDNRLWVGSVDATPTQGSRGGGDVLYSDDGQSFTRALNTNGDRVEIGVAPSDAAVVYAIIENNSTVMELYKSLDSGATWQTMSKPDDADPGIPANDFSRGQAWYDLIVQVDPNNPGTIVAGGIDLFRSQDTGQSWQQLSHWYGGFGYPEVHADQHQFLFAPGSSDRVLNGNDGGVYYAGNFSSNFPTWRKRNNSYNVTQFYAAAAHPQAGNEFYLAGAQDNGTQLFQGPGLVNTREATGGDGGFCFIDQDEPNVQITSYVYSNYRLSTNGGQWFSDMQLSSNNQGRFINPCDYDDSLDILYAARNVLQITRVRNIGNAGGLKEETLLARGMQSIPSALKVSPHHRSSTTLFVGTNSGQILRIDSADGQSGTPQVQDLTKTNLPTAYVSSIQVGAHDGELLVTYSNYGVPSVWHTQDSGATWRNVEGNLPDMPVRWGLFNPRDYDIAVLATELGTWMTYDLSASPVVWRPANNGLANVRTDMLQLRQSDYTLVAATHGRGLFTSQFESGIGLPEVASGKAADWQVEVYPQPASAFIQLEWRSHSVNTGAFEARLLSTTGQLVQRWNWDTSAGQKRLTLAEHPQGTYVLVVQAGGQSYRQQVLIQP